MLTMAEICCCFFVCETCLTPSCFQRDTGRDPGARRLGGGGGGGLYLRLHCHCQNEICVKTGSSENHLKASLMMRGSHKTVSVNHNF